MCVRFQKSPRLNVFAEVPGRLNTIDICKTIELMLFLPVWGFWAKTFNLQSRFFPINKCEFAQYNNFPDLGDFNKNSRKETISTIFAKREYR